MLAPMNFRSAINGFRREDVVSYIEYLSARHADEVNQLKSEVEYLKNKTAPVAAGEEDPQIGALNSRIQELLERCAQLEDQHLAEAIEAEDKLRAALSRCEELEAQLTQAQTARDQAEESAQVRTDQAQQELEAYRRAERTERLAQERAEQLLRDTREEADRMLQQAREYADSVTAQANALLAEAAVQAENTARDIGDLTEGALQQLRLLETAVRSGRQTLTAAAEALCAVRSGQE